MNSFYTLSVKKTPRYFIEYPLERIKIDCEVWCTKVEICNNRELLIYCSLLLTNLNFTASHCAHKPISIFNREKLQNFKSQSGAKEVTWFHNFGWKEGQKNCAVVCYQAGMPEGKQMVLTLACWKFALTLICKGFMSKWVLDSLNWPKKHLSTFHFSWLVLFSVYSQ